LRVHYGRARFQMATLPASPGSRLQGIVHLPQALASDARIGLTLTCYSRSFDSDFPDTVLWQTEDVVSPLESSELAGQIPVRIDIPATCSASDPLGQRGGPYWRLHLAGLARARGLDVSFEVPVFVTTQTSAALSRGPQVEVRERRPTASRVIFEHPSPDVTRFRFEFGAVAKFFVLVLPFASPAVLFMPALVSLPVAIVSVVLIVGFAVLTHWSEPMGLEISRDGVVVSHGYRGWFRPQRIPLADVRRVRLKDCVNAFKQVEITTRGLEEYGISRVTTVMEARWIASEVRHALVALGVTLEDA
jgi:hypothetical protein